jgi:hypothetical protein
MPKPRDGLDGGFLLRKGANTQGQAPGRESYVFYLLTRGKLRTKHIDQPNPSDASYLVAELEANPTAEDVETR